MEELWADVKGYVGVYQVSNRGNVRKLCEGGIKSIKATPNSAGYLSVHLYSDSCKNCKLVTVHRLVAEHFLENPEGFPVINHKDENKTNNDAANLEWCTQEYNVRYSLERRRDECARSGDNSGLTRKRKYTSTVIRCDLQGRELEDVGPLIEFCKDNGFNTWSIIQCCKGNRQKAYGFKWKFSDARIAL